MHTWQSRSGRRFQGLKHICNHSGSAEAHEQACSSCAANDVAVLWPRSVTQVQISENCRLTTNSCHLWDKHVSWWWWFMPVASST